MTKSETDKRDMVVSSMLKIYNYLRSRGGLDPRGEDISFLHWNNYPTNPEQRKLREQMDNVIKLIKEHNPELSDISIYQSLLFGLTQKAIWFPIDFPDIENEYRKAADQLLAYSATRDIDIPIVNLQIEKKTVKFGLTTFHPIEKSDKEGDWWDAIKGTAGEYTSNIYSFARVSCPGDTTKSLDYGTEVVSEMLTILRATGFPIKPESYHMNFWLVNEYPLFQTRPYRLGLPNENLRLDYNPQVIHRLGPGVVICNLQNDILDSVEPSTLNDLQTLIENDFSNPSTEMMRKFFLGLHWLGEATKPDTNEARFAKLAFAIEALIGGDAEDKKGILSTRGLTATLAERGAFIAGSNLIERQLIHKQISEFYGIRSGIVHGGNKTITNDQLDKFSSLVRKVTWALLSHINDFKNLIDLQEWVLKQRYS
jgi:hypothetical protein